MSFLPPLSERQFQTIFEQSPFGIIVFGPEGDCLGANNAWAKIWDAPRDQLVGYNILNDPHIDNEDALRIVRRAFDGESHELPVMYYDPVANGLKGRPRYVQGFVFPIKDEANQVRQVVISFIDVTAQERAKRELSASRDFLAAISRIVPTIIAVYDVTTGEYLHLSDAFEKLLGYPTEQARKAGAPFMVSLMHPEDVQKILAQQEEALQALGVEKPDEQTHPTIPFEYRMKASDGSWKCLRTLGSVFQRDEAGRVKTVINASLDITELKEAICFRDEFLAIASHELKTPLTSLRLQFGLINSLLGPIEDNSKRDCNSNSIEVLSKVTRMAGQQFDRLTGLVNSLLDVSRITLGRLALRCEETDLGSFVRGVAEAFKSQASEANCLLNVVAPAGIRTSFDTLRIGQVISNLVMNAIVHATTPVVELRVESHPELNQVRIIVRDEGKGIEQKDLERIFERFERSGSDQSTGLGLGLFIARQITRAHGGEITVQSHIGKGTSFTVELSF